MFVKPDGPFAEAKEVIGGYWIIQVRSREEAIERARRAPMDTKDIFRSEMAMGCREYVLAELQRSSSKIDMGTSFQKITSHFDAVKVIAHAAYATTFRCPKPFFARPEESQTSRESGEVKG